MAWPSRPSALLSATSTAIARRVCLRICSRPSATSLARTLTSASTNRGCFTPSGWNPIQNRPRNQPSRKSNHAGPSKVTMPIYVYETTDTVEANPPFRGEAEHERGAASGGSENRRGGAAGHFRRLRRPRPGRIDWSVSRFGWFARIGLRLLLSRRAEMLSSRAAQTGATCATSRRSALPRRSCTYVGQA